MSVNYAAGLSAYDNKGKLGLPEMFDSPSELKRKVHILTEWVRSSKHIVAHTGAGVSTAAGIPDFRGPKGVWTLEAEGDSPIMNVTFDEAVPTLTHMALLTLERLNILKFLITQNVDGLHMRSGFPKDRMAELHGNVFVEKCDSCEQQHVQQTAIGSVGQKDTGRLCNKKRGTGQPCRGRLKDTVLDWEAALPPEELQIAEQQCHLADLSICLGSTLQIVPAGTLPVLTKKNGGRLVIVNLQQTKQDKHADLIIHAKVDDVMLILLKNLRIQCYEYMGPVFLPHSLHRIVTRIRKPKKRRRRRRKQSEKKTPVAESPTNGVESSRGSKKRSAALTAVIPVSSPAIKRRRVASLGAASSTTSPATFMSPITCGGVGCGRENFAIGGSAAAPSFDVNYDGVVRLSFDAANAKRGATPKIVGDRRKNSGVKQIVTIRKSVDYAALGVDVSDADDDVIDSDVDDVIDDVIDGQSDVSNDDDDVRLCEFLPSKKRIQIEARFDDVIDGFDDIVLPG